MLHPFINTAVHSHDAPLLTAAWVEQYFTSYFPSPGDRRSITASPGLMSADQAKLYLPSITVITSEIDGLRDQGEDFARLLQKAGADVGVVRAVSSMHDFEIFNASRSSPTAKLIMTMIAGKLKEVLL